MKEQESPNMKVLGKWLSLSSEPPVGCDEDCGLALLPSLGSQTDTQTDTLELLPTNPVKFFFIGLFDSFSETLAQLKSCSLPLAPTTSSFSYPVARSSQHIHAVTSSVFPKQSFLDHIVSCRYNPISQHLEEVVSTYV